MEEVRKKNNIEQKALAEDDVKEKDDCDKEINSVIRREEVMNIVLEKLIDKLNQPHEKVSN
jgi:hypothetical protein